MSDQESTPFLVHDDEQDYHQDSHYINVHSKPANAHFKRALRLLTAILTVLAVGAGVVMIIAIVRMKSGPFSYVDETTKHMTGLTIVVSISCRFRLSD